MIRQGALGGGGGGERNRRSRSESIVSDIPFSRSFNHLDVPQALPIPSGRRAADMALSKREGGLKPGRVGRRGLKALACP